MQNLQDHFLIAMPAMGDPNFNETVTYIFEHTEKNGALGIIINRPLGMELGEIFSQFTLSTTEHSQNQKPVLNGGPVHRDRGFVVHNSTEQYDSTLETSVGLKLTTSQDILSSMAGGKGPHAALVALGCAGWGAGQLEAELLANTWLSVPADLAIVFETPFDLRWAAAIGLLGVDIDRLSSYAGHA
ncbi:MAG: YqgE/AlgH family protein [Pseudomonadota bacterium]|nr:YqgE/AlgH family protein [Pseudomonadota bacterium]